jgi:predicted CopG family antitoxin
MATREGYSTITISEELKGRLKAMKAHPRQSYEEVIVRVLDELDKRVEEE